jgi:hypothetical protein
MNEAGPNELREELAALEVEEALVSADRRYLHHQIDFGYASETTRIREREVSTHRRDLHRRIDALRERLGMPTGAQPTSSETSLDQFPADSPIGKLQRIVDDTQHTGAPADHRHTM